MAVPGQVQDPGRIEAAEVSIPTDEGELQSYLARPADEATHPALIVIHEAFGLVEHIRDVARRFAAAGFVALAPDLYSRVGPPDPDDIDSVLDKMFSLPDDRIVSDVDACAGWLRGRAWTADRVGCIGFCSGGRQALLAACSTDALDAAVDCWGGFVTRATYEDQTTEQRPIPPMELVGALRCPLFAVFGAEDDNPSPADAQQLRRRLEDVDVPTEVRVFEGAGHAFLADYRDSYREGPAFELWPQAVGFLRSHLVG